MRVVALGGCGVVGAAAVKAVLDVTEAEEIVVHLRPEHLPCIWMERVEVGHEIACEILDPLFEVELVDEPRVVEFIEVVRADMELGPYRNH